METQDRRRRVFDNALAWAAGACAPQAIVIACNSLSAIYDLTPFARQPRAAVMGIMDIGVEEILAALGRWPGGQVILAATTTTAQSGEYERRLAARGVAQGAFFCHDCPGVAGVIERDGRGAESRAKIERFMSVAARRAAADRPVILSLNCTHFSYAPELFVEGLAKAGVEVKETLDPTVKMAERFLAGAPRGRFDRTDVSVEVISQAPLAEAQKRSIGALIEPRSARTAAALWRGRCEAGLFDIT